MTSTPQNKTLGKVMAAPHQKWKAVRSQQQDLSQFLTTIDFFFIYTLRYYVVNGGVKKKVRYFSLLNNRD